MTTAEIITLISAIGALLLGVFNVVKIWRTTPSEIREVDSSSMRTYIETAGIAGKQARDALIRCDALEKEVSRLEGEVKILRKEVENKDKRISSLEAQVDELKNLSSRLELQITGLGVVPTK